MFNLLPTPIRDLFMINSAISLKALTLVALTVNLLYVGISIGLMGIGWNIIDKYDDNAVIFGKFSGFLEPYITKIAHK
ncbi:MAG: hypothetical protein JXA99_05055 [Candidatus Lokiarchaeota archaeon]|nr:hypothetical protein [Candidatus Lokiarchaeota archaeon]